MAVDTPSLVAASALGVLAHLAYFKQSEHHLYGTRYMQLGLLAMTTAGALLIRVGEKPFGDAISTVLTVGSAFLAGVFGSLLTYRVLFHPLNKFPGPLPARVSSLWYTTKVLNADAHFKMLDLHKKYGDFVRIGSNDLSIAHPKGPAAVYGPGTKCYKAGWYDNDTPLNSMHTSRNRTMHDKRRRIWSPAFSDKALRGYEDRVRPYGDKLKSRMAEMAGKPVNVTSWFNFFTFDTMGDLAFGESFGMLEAGKEHWAIQLLNEGMEPLHLMLPPWCFRILTAIPGAAEGYWKFISYCSQKLDQRWEKKENNDIMASLLEPYKTAGKPTGEELSYLQGDARLIIVAGSDTTAATLTHLFYHLAKDPSRVAKLRAELAPFTDKNGDVDNRNLLDCEYLNGCLSETLRLNPPVPTYVARITPPEGITVGETYVPGNMTVWCPQYVISRSEKAYKDAETFAPERWNDGSDMIKEKTAFAPFSLGVYGCIGKPLALMELRTIAAKLIHAFDIKFADGEDGSALLNKTRDHFTLGLADLNLVFTPVKA